MYLLEGPYPDETIYSMIARMRLGSTEPLIDFSELRFATQHLHIHPVLPAHIHAVSELFNVDSVSLLLKHTGYGLSALCLPAKEDRIKLREAMLGDDGRHIMTLSRQSQSRLHLPYAHKLCDECMKQDTSQFGVPYWHVTHHLYGVSVCPIHQSVLHSIDATTIPGFALPPDKTSHQQEVVGTNIHMLSSFIISLRHYLCQQTPLRPLHQYYQLHLDKLGYIAGPHQIRLRDLTDDLKQHWTPLLSSKTVDVPSSLFEFNFLSRMVHTEHPFHYLKHALLMAFLCETAKDFFDVEVPITQPRSTRNRENAYESSSDAYICEYLEKGYSLNKVSKRSGRSVGYLKQLAAREGIGINQRPKRITKAIKRGVWRKALMGIDRKRIASAFKISTGSVELIIQSHKGLSSWRRHLKKQRNRLKYREQLLSAIEEHPDASRTELKAISSSYHWLYKHDNEWLYQNLPPKKKLTFHPQKTWEELDSELYKEISEKVVSARSFTDIDRQCGNRGWLPKQKQRLPKSTALAVSIIFDGKSSL